MLGRNTLAMLLRNFRNANIMRVQELLPARCSLQLRWLGWLVKKLRRRLPHPVRVVWSFLRRQLQQPPGDERLAQHLLPAQPGLHVQRLGRLERELW